MFFNPALVPVGLAMVCFPVHIPGQIIDLTHELSNETVYWPGSPTFEFNILIREQLERYWYESNNFSTAEHGGTHLDAPAHFFKGKRRVHEIPLANLIGPGIVIDISARAQENPDTEVQVEDILKWEGTYGKIPSKAIVLMNSGWTKNWPDKEKVFGTTNITDFRQFHYPGFSPSAIRWLVENRPNINGIGVDTPSMDYGQSVRFETHVALGEANLVGFENVANLNKVSPTGMTIFAIPIKIHDGSGAPIRMFAMSPGELTSSAKQTRSAFIYLCFPLLFFLS